MPKNWHYFLKIILYFVTLFSFVKLDKNVFITNELYGPYKLIYDNIRKCSSKENSMTDMNITLIKENDQKYLALNGTFRDTEPIREVSLILYSFKNNMKNKVFNIIDRKPCKNFLFQELFIKKVTRDCILRPGKKFSVKADLKIIEDTLYGSSFFYGKYVCKSQVTGSKGRVIACVLIDMIFEKP